MTATTWRCKGCDTTGDGEVPAYCPACPGVNFCPDDDIMSKAGLFTALQQADWLKKRLEDISGRIGAGMDSYEINLNDTLEDSSIHLAWKEYRCSCCGPEHCAETIPATYLLMSWDDIKLAEEERKGATRKREAEEKLRQKIEETERQLASAKKRAATASSEAEAEAKRLAAELASLKGGA